MKIKIFVLIAAFFCFFSFDKVHADVLDFKTAPSISEYKKNRGSDNLKYVLFGLAQLYSGGASVRNWDELEKIGQNALKDVDFDSMAEFIAETQYSYRFTLFGYNLIMDSLRKGYTIEDKNYFDSGGFYKTLNGASIKANEGFYIDVANLFKAKVVYLTAMPVDGGYRLDPDGSLYVNEIRLTVESSDYAKYKPSISYVSSPTSENFQALPVLNSNADSVVYSMTTKGSAKDISYLKVSKKYDESDFPLSALAQLKITVLLGNDSRTQSISGSGVISDVSEGGVLYFDPKFNFDSESGIVDGNLVKKSTVNSPVTDDSDGDSDDGGGGGILDFLSKLLELLGDLFGGFFDKLIDFLANNFITDLLKKLFDGLFSFIIPDFDGIQNSFSDFVDNFKAKFQFVFQIKDYLDSLFSSEKSLYDFYIVYRGEKLYPFPKSRFETIVPVFRNVANIFVFLWTCIIIYKRFVGEGDAIAT